MTINKHALPLFLESVLVVVHVPPPLLFFSLHLRQVVCINVASRENAVNAEKTKAAGLQDKVRVFGLGLERLLRCPVGSFCAEL